MGAAETSAPLRNGLVCCLAALALTGCAPVGPDYVRPTAVISPQYKELKGWKIARPSDDAAKTDWWKIFKDPILDRFEPQVAVSNQNVIAAEAHFRQALALIAQAHSTLLPVLNFAPSATRDSVLGNELSAQAGLSWTLDIWGKARRAVEQAEANADASSATLANARLASQAALALAYVEVRQADALKDMLAGDIVEFKRTLQITEDQYRAGATDKSSFLQAEAQVLNAQSQVVQADIARGLAENGIAALMGLSPLDLSIDRGALPRQIPEVPVGLPTALLERRPDVAAAERAMAAANAEIGIAFAGYYPDLSLSGNFGYTNSSAATQQIASSNTLLQKLAGGAATPAWTFGLSIAQTLFNGGLTDAEVAAARASYDASVANYRESVLTALQGVENALLTIHRLADQDVLQTKAAAISRQAVEIALNEYQAGATTYVAVSTAQLSALADEEAELATRAARLSAAINLVVGLGGGWSVADIRASRP
jgi:NodT family efflux transporter outer membrane factor (OMF) lipoprotein